MHNNATNNRVRVEEKIFSVRPDEVWVRVICENCGNALNTNRYDKTEWEEYMKERFIAKHSNYCPDCGEKLSID